MLATAFSSFETSQPHPTADSIDRPKPDALAESFSSGALRSIGSKEHLYCEGDRAVHVWRVEVGHLCLYRMMPDGRRQVIDFAYPGDIVGLGALAEHAESAQAMERSVVRGVPIAKLREAARSDSRLGMTLCDALARELQAARELLYTVSQRTAVERVAAFLIALSRRNRRRGECETEIVLPMTRLDIADFLGLTIETVSRSLTRLRGEGIIDLEQCILVTICDYDRLLSLAEGAAEARTR